MLLYYSHSKGLKSGGFRSDALTSNGMLVAFEDEEVLAHEVGIKWDPTDRLRFNAAAFYYDYQKPQQRVPVEVPPFGQLSTMTNLDSAEVTGVEAELLWIATDSLELGLNGSFLATEISDSRPEVNGNDLAFAPDAAYFAFGRFQTDLGANLSASFQLNVGVTGDHYLTVFNDDFEKQDHTLVGFNAALFNAAKGWTLSVYGKNIGNEIYVTNFFGDGGVFISEPQSFGVRLRYDF
jgi:iron complex outermembrane receptor protein